MKNNIAAFIFIFSIACQLLAANNSLSDLPKKAIDQSQLTLPGSRPFHLRAKIVEMTNPDNKGFNAEIEEFWVAPDKWRRTVKSAGFSETLVVNGDKVREEITGEYYPNWLRTLVNAIFDPGGQIAGIDLTRSSDNPVIGGTKTCRRFSSPAGIPPVGNRVFHSFCFDNGLLDSVIRPGYRAEYFEYKKFSDRKVARKVQESLEPGTTLEARVDELNELTTVDENIFRIDEPTSVLRAVAVDEHPLRGLATLSPAIQWSSVRAGKTSGVLSVYVCIDRTGHVRETYALNSDQPVMSEDAQRQVMKWQIKPATLKGTAVQVEGILTFAYETKLDPVNGK